MIQISNCVTYGLCQRSFCSTCFLDAVHIGRLCHAPGDRRIIKQMRNRGFSVILLCWGASTKKVNRYGINGPIMNRLNQSDVSFRTTNGQYAIFKIHVVLVISDCLLHSFYGCKKLCNIGYIWGRITWTRVPPKITLQLY